jgi:hypothetical protein
MATARHRKSVGNGNYEIKLTIPQSGVYMVFFESSSRHVCYRDLPHLMLQGVGDKKTLDLDFPVELA